MPSLLLNYLVLGLASAASLIPSHDIHPHDRHNATTLPDTAAAIPAPLEEFTNATINRRAYPFVNAPYPDVIEIRGLDMRGHFDEPLGGRFEFNEWKTWSLCRCIKNPLEYHCTAEFECGNSDDEKRAWAARYTIRVHNGIDHKWGLSVRSAGMGGVQKSGYIELNKNMVHCEEFYGKDHDMGYSWCWQMRDIYIPLTRMP